MRYARRGSDFDLSRPYAGGPNQRAAATRVVPVEQACDHLMKGLGAEVQVFSVTARAQTVDIPDRRYYMKGVAFWCECKADKISRTEAKLKNLEVTDRHADKLSAGQLAFLAREYAAGQIVFAGDEVALRGMMLCPVKDWRQVGWNCVRAVEARGLRA